MSEWQKLIGHEWAATLLQGAIQHERIGHAYLLTGPAQVGKTTLARLFAQALNCLAEPPQERPCGQCRPCQLIAVDRHPDVRLVKGEVSGRGRLMIKIDQIRELQQALNLAAYEARYKVAILRQFDAANPNAANAFLKMLEEPPGRVVLLLTAVDADNLLPTIASRCRVIPLRPLPADLIEQALGSRWRVPADEARLLAHLANGRLGWAARAAQEPALLDERSDQLAFLQEALNGARVDRFQLAEKLAGKPEQLPDLLQTWLGWWRDATLLAWGQEHNGAVINIDQEPVLRRLAQKHSPADLLHSLKQTERAIWQLEHNANTRLVLENLFLAYPREE